MEAAEYSDIGGVGRGYRLPTFQSAMRKMHVFGVAYKKKKNKKPRDLCQVRTSTKLNLTKLKDRSQDMTTNILLPAVQLKTKNTIPTGRAADKKKVSDFLSTVGVISSCGYCCTRSCPPPQETSRISCSSSLRAQGPEMSQQRNIFQLFPTTAHTRRSEQKLLRVPFKRPRQAHEDAPHAPWSLGGTVHYSQKFLHPNHNVNYEGIKRMSCYQSDRSKSDMEVWSLEYWSKPQSICLSPTLLHIRRIFIDPSCYF